MLFLHPSSDIELKRIKLPSHGEPKYLIQEFCGEWNSEFRWYHSQPPLLPAVLRIEGFNFSTPLFKLTGFLQLVPTMVNSRCFQNLPKVQHMAFLLEIELLENMLKTVVSVTITVAISWCKKEHNGSRCEMGSILNRGNRSREKNSLLLIVGSFNHVNCREEVRLLGELELKCG